MHADMKAYCFSQWEGQEFVVADSGQAAVEAYAKSRGRNYTAIDEGHSGDPQGREYLFTLYESDRKESRRLGGGVRVYQYDFETNRVYP